jgi:hypothetical protein
MVMAQVKYKEDGTPYLSDDWYIMDVESVCERMGVTLTDEEMEDVLHDVAGSFDANYGITWDSFEEAIESIMFYKESRDAK